ncbi:Protein kinase-like domain protein [Akanthomyces lecanii RCEF 1005]|uniref:Protein kinase-like domain protein n=1 Tax=Akanthomyces lecanii RCEF 1005 TaxID=1081108 RepID=A0A168I6V2_CORDF|nr:Protein kinase-like domain protein [Akanthomyces lecanii RCEF 1005]
MTIIQAFRRDELDIRNHERITNEAKALELVAQNTDIPVPRLIEHGIHDDGRRYLVTQRIYGITLDRIGQTGCMAPFGRAHTSEGRCRTCIKDAHGTARIFIENSVIPRLYGMWSHERGIDGFEMPPSWLVPDTQPPWKGNKAAFKTLPLPGRRYNFQHGDLGAFNIMMDRHTLQVKALLG